MLGDTSRELRMGTGTPKECILRFERTCSASQIPT